MSTLKLQEIKNCRPKMRSSPRNLIIMHGTSVLYYTLLASQLCCISYVHQLTAHIFGREKPQRIYEYLQCLRCGSFSLSHFTRDQCANCIPPAFLVNDTSAECKHTRWAHHLPKTSLLGSSGA